MNARQLAVLWLGIAAIGVLTFYVPYILNPMAIPGFDGSTMINERYATLFAPPKGTLSIDWARVVICMVFVSVVTLGGILSLSPKRAGS